MRRHIWRGSAIIAGVVAVLIAAELALRVRYRRRVLPHTPPVPGTVTLAALGDSITAGAPGEPAQAWPNGLLAHLHAGYPGVVWRIVNAGVSGDTAPLGYARFDRDVAAPGPQGVLIAFGLNDCYPDRRPLDLWLQGCVPKGLARSYAWRAGRARVERLGRRLGWLAAPVPEPKRRGLPRTTLDGFAAALESLVLRTRAIHAQPILLTMTPLAPHDTPGVKMRLAAYPAYNTRVRRLAAEHHLLLVELSSGAPTQAFDADGFHLTRDGQTWVAGQVYDQLRAAGLWTGLARRAGRNK